MCCKSSAQTESTVEFLKGMMCFLMLFRFSPPWERYTSLPVCVYCVKSIVVSEMGKAWQVLVFAIRDLPWLKYPAAPKRALQLFVAQAASSMWKPLSCREPTIGLACLLHGKIFSLWFCLRNSFGKCITCI